MAKYSDQLNLDCDPFDSSEPTSHYYPGGNRQDTLDQLVEMSSNSSDLAVVTGPLGSGKSTLARWLALSLEDDFVTVQVEATLFMSKEQLLEALCTALALDIEPGAPADYLVDLLDSYAESLRGRFRTLQLLVDDAHELGAEALQALLTLKERQSDASRLGEDGIKLVLFGEATLLSSVQQLAGAGYVDLQLNPLTAEETVDYMEFKLAGAGFDGKLPLDMDEITVIQVRGKGIPGMINALIADQLSGSRLQHPTLPNLGFLERHLVAASVLFGTLLLVLFFTQGSDNSEPGAGDRELAVANQPVSAPTGNLQRRQIPLEINSPGSRPGLSAETANQQAVDVAETSSLQSEAGAKEAQADIPTSEPPPAVSLSRPVSAPPGLADGGARVASDAISKPAPAPQPAVGERTVSARSTAGPVPSATGQALLARAPESYTLQLLGSYSESNVKSFIASNGASGELSYFQSSYQDRPWFVVVHGSYPDRGSARDAIGRLPQSLQELKPWARSLSDIQSDIRLHQ